eukprot:TRINITY_DN4360_c0_g1_i1.p1 TRINITY_DN4360_c0_g1~~TRINITY_DN4360_c0_g1_i1.p1  ORF type:complete len:196 (-),score=15.24 TRINITY_DN4360_c0_g1_i1:393-980(-)
MFLRASFLTTLVYIMTTAAMDMPSFEQQFMTLVVEKIAGTNYFYGFDYPYQRDRYDIPTTDYKNKPVNQTDLGFYGNNGTEYQFESREGVQTSCAQKSQFHNSLDEFSFDTNILTFYNGTDMLDGVKCHTWNMYNIFGQIEEQFWVTFAQPYKPVRHYIAMGLDAPPYDFWYLYFCYDCFTEDTFQVPILNRARR